MWTTGIHRTMLNRIMSNVISAVRIYNGLRRGGGVRNLLYALYEGGVFVLMFITL